MLDEEVHRSARFGYEFSLLFLDMDHFKDVNDKYGHIVGSKLIGMVGQCLRENLRLIDAAFRYGGDEFAILLPQTSRDSALFVARRIARAFHSREWRPEENISLQLRASIGVAGYPHDATTPQEIVQRADESDVPGEANWPRQYCRCRNRNRWPRRSHRRRFRTVASGQCPAAGSRVADHFRR